MILVSGLINIEITLKSDGFPIHYTPVRYPFFGVNSSVSGVGYNVSKALTVLGNEVSFLSLIGQDSAQYAIEAALKADYISDKYVLRQLSETAHSVIIYDSDGKRQINVDLKDIQEQKYPPEIFEEAVKNCSLAVLTNINFSRPFLFRALEMGKMIAVDVHTIADLNDSYNQDFMKYAHILFMSHEKLPCLPEEWVQQVMERYGTEIVVVGLGSEGALLAVKRDQFMQRIPAVKTRPIVNTIGAGDALFSAFIHFYNKNSDPYEALKKAVVFASYKIGEKGAAMGFLTEAELNNLVAELA